uniref:Uncharacterized protein MANES_09G044400 n=2 Tax=Rhizophora mucronata TaxID=61149 RepID=A0A2P2IQ46_RHIMU
MAASTLASAPVRAKLSNLSFNHTQRPHPTGLLSKPFNIPLKPINLHVAHVLNSLSPPSLPHFFCSFAAFDSFEATQDGNFEGQDDPEAETEEFELEQEEKPAVSNEEAKLYVGNLPYSMTSEQLAEAFLEGGSVVNVEVISDRVTGRSRGFGFVTMGSVEEANEAIRMFNGAEVGGRTLRVNFPEVPKGGEREIMGPRIRSSYKGFVDSPHKIYAGNLGWGLTSQGLRDAFANQQGLLSAKVIYERETGRSRGFGFVTFETAEDADAAMSALNGVEVEGRPLRLNLAANRARPPPTPRSLADNDSENSELFSSISA